MAEPAKAPSKIDSAPKKKLRHMVEDGSYYHKASGLFWSPASGQVHPTDEEPALSERELARLLSLKFTTPDKRRTLMDRFKLID
jgi:hypothetical protein